MTITSFQLERPKGNGRPRVSLRTLILTLELLAAVVALQYLGAGKPAQAGAVWLADDRPVTLFAPAEGKPGR